MNLDCYLPHRYFYKRNYSILEQCLYSHISLAFVNICFGLHSQRKFSKSSFLLLAAQQFQIFFFLNKEEPFVTRGKFGISLRYDGRKCNPYASKPKKKIKAQLYFVTFFTNGLSQEKFRISSPPLFFFYRNKQPRIISRLSSFSFWVLLSRSVEAQKV